MCYESACCSTKEKWRHRCAVSRPSTASGTRSVGTSPHSSRRLTAIVLKTRLCELRVLHIETASHSRYRTLSQSRVQVAGNLHPFWLIFRVTVAVMADPGLLASFSWLVGAQRLTSVDRTGGSCPLAAHALRKNCYVQQRCPCGTDYIHTPPGRSTGRGHILHADCQVALLEGLGNCSVEDLPVGQCTSPRIGALERAQPGRLLAATRRVAGGPNRVPSTMGAQIPRTDLMPKARPNRVRGRTLLALHECHRALIPGSHEPHVGSQHSLPILGGASGGTCHCRCGDLGHFGLDMWIQPEDAVPVA